MSTHPTPHPAVNLLLYELVSGLQTILGNDLVGVYLFGSLAYGDFDENSDIDVAVITEQELTEAQFEALREMHVRIATLDSPWANQIEVSYLTKSQLRHYDRANSLHPHLDRGAGEQLGRNSHARVVERHVLREQGLTVLGPSLKDLIDPVSANELRHAMQEMAPDWLIPDLNEPGSFSSRGYQSYTVLTICRILYTLEFGAVASKPVAAVWAIKSLDERWKPLIERALKGRQYSQVPPDAEDVKETKEFIRYLIDLLQTSRRS